MNEGSGSCVSLNDGKAFQTLIEGYVGIVSDVLINKYNNESKGELLNSKDDISNTVIFQSTK